MPGSPHEANRWMKQECDPIANEPLRSGVQFSTARAAQPGQSSHCDRMRNKRCPFCHLAACAPTPASSVNRLLVISDRRDRTSLRVRGPASECAHHGTRYALYSRCMLDHATRVAHVRKLPAIAGRQPLRSPLAVPHVGGHRQAGERGIVQRDDGRDPSHSQEHEPLANVLAAMPGHAFHDFVQ
jgi:hypothetical protein